MTVAIVNGWTVVTPSGDSRLVYVSSSGGDNGNDGLSEQYPKATIASGRALLRDGYPDHLLLKRGDRWEESIADWNLAGRSTQEPMMVGAYGTGDAPSLIGLSRYGYDRYDAHVVFMSLDLYIPARDPGNPAYDPDLGLESPVGIAWMYSGDWGGEDFLFEDIRIRAMSYGIGLHAAASDPVNRMHNIRIRRCVILDSYLVDTAGHSQGWYSSDVDDVFLEDCILDHNGWAGSVVDGVWSGPTGTAPTIYNHNFYLGYQSGLTIRSNLFMRPSSQNMKFRSDFTGDMIGVTVTRNTIIGGEIGIGIGGNADGTVSRFQTVSVTENVLMYTGRDITRDIAWSIVITDVNGAEIARNLIANQTERSNSFALSLTFSATDVNVHHNVAYRVNDAVVQVNLNSSASGVTVQSNKWQEPVETPESGPTAMYDVLGGIGYASFSNNVYHTDFPTRFADLLGDDSTFAEWVTASGETGANEAVASFPDPTRTPETYDSAMGGPGTYAHFIEEVRARTRANWGPYSPAAVTDYLRAGFGMSEAVSLVGHPRFGRRIVQAQP